MFKGKFDSVLRRGGHSTFYYDTSDCRYKQGCLSAVDSAPLPTVLLDRTRDFINDPVEMPTFNHFGMKALCRNKLAMSLELGQWAPQDYTLPSQFDPAGSETFQHFVETTVEKRAIVKPNLGFGSLGLALVSQADARKRPDLGTKCEAIPSAEINGFLGEWIAQEWVRPATVRMNGHRYYFDLRAFVVNGRAVAGFARRAAAPVAGCSETPKSPG